MRWADGKGKMWPRASLSCAFKYRTPTNQNDISTFPALPNLVLILLQFSMMCGRREEKRTAERVCVEVFCDIQGWGSDGKRVECMCQWDMDM